MRRGQAGRVVLGEPLGAGPGGGYRVATHLVGSPGAADGDGVDDLAELACLGAGARAPLNLAVPIAAEHGATAGRGSGRGACGAARA